MKKLIVAIVATFVACVLCGSLLGVAQVSACEENEAAITAELTATSTKKNGWVEKNGKLRYYKNGEYVTGLKKIGDYKYFFSKKGYMQTNCWKNVGDRRFYFGDDGKAKTGLVKIDGKRFYFNSSCVMVRSSWKTVNGKRYYFMSNGKAATGLKKIGSSYYYFSNKGVMYQEKWVYVKGYKRYFGENGKMSSDVDSVLGTQSSYYIVVNKGTNVVTVYAKDGDKGYTIPVKSFICSTGASTPIGTFKTSDKYRWRALYGPCYGQWCTRITGHILFHSVPYYTQNNNDLEVDEYNLLGTSASMGCVRVTAENAKWIYDNCSKNTTVKIINGTSSDDPISVKKAVTLASGHTWDPTDPNMAYKCEENGCH